MSALRKVIWFFTCLLAVSGIAQVGINTSTPSVDAMLDINSSDKGLLIPRVSISDLSTIAPITGGATESLLVYNTNTTTGKGFYYWDGVLWKLLQNFNLYTEDSNLTGNRNVSQTTNTLQFSGNVGRNQLIIKRTDNTTETGLAFRNSDDTFDGAIYMEQNSSTGLVIATGGNENDVNSLTPTVIFKNDNKTTFQDNVGIFENDPQEALHITGASKTMRIEDLDSSNVNNIVGEPSPVYVDDSGNLVLQPTLQQNFMPIDDINFINRIDISTENSDGSINTDDVGANLYGRLITLTRESLVHISYHMSVSDINLYNGSSISDGAPRTYRSYVRVFENNIAAGERSPIAWGSGFYTSRAGGNITDGYYYINGSGYVTLPAGTHSVFLRAEIIGAGYELRVAFGKNDDDRFQVVVIR